MCMSCDVCDITGTADTGQSQPQGNPAEAKAVTARKDRKNRFDQFLPGITGRNTTDFHIDNEFTKANEKRCSKVFSIFYDWKRAKRYSRTEKSPVILWNCI